MIEEPVKLIQPRDHTAKVLIWLDLTVNDMDKLDDAVTADHIKEELASVFKLGDFRKDLKTGVLVDLYYYTINFARENHFSKEQTSAFFSIVKRTHEVCVETPFGNVNQCFNYFRELVLCHAVKRPPFSIDLFSAADVRKITDYVLNTYFRHYKMYKYVFTPLVRLDLSMTYAGIPPTPPSSEGKPEAPGSIETDSEEPKDETPPADRPRETQEECEAGSELRQLIRSYLSEEIKSVRSSMEAKLRESEEALNQRLANVEGSNSAKGSRGSGKSRKK